jgi:uncharacterized protein DUF4031
MYEYEYGQFGRMKMSHMVADSLDELHAMADKIGVARKWFQNSATMNVSHDHYDISLSKRRLAVANGAIEIDVRELGRMIMAKGTRKPRSKKGDAKNPGTASLLAALKFIEPAAKESGPAVQINYTHCAMGWNWAVAFDGVIALAHKIDTDIQAYPNTKTLIKALSKCEETTQITQLDENRLAIKSGRFSAYVPCMRGELFHIQPPDDPLYPIDERVPAALAIVGRIAKENAPRLVLSSVMLRNGSAVATDGHILFEAWHGATLPFQVVLPKDFVTKLCAIQKKPVSMGASANTVTVWFEDQSWIRTQLYNERFPDCDKVLNTPANLAEIPKGLWEALGKIEPMTDVAGAVLFNTKDNTVSTHAAGNVGASCIVEGPLPADLSFDIEKLRLFEPFANQVDFTAQSGSGIMAVFYGPNFRGMLMSMRRHDRLETASPAYTEETCPGHVASADDPKICGRCGTHIDSLRPDDPQPQWTPPAGDATNVIPGPPTWGQQQPNRYDDDIPF